MAISRQGKKTALQRLGARARGTPPPGYPKKKKQYADPKRFKYPVNTPKRVRAAIGYFGDAKNREGYSAEELRGIARKIVAGARKFKIAVDPGSAVGRFAGLKKEGGGNPGRRGKGNPYGSMRGRLKGIK